MSNVVEKMYFAGDIGHGYVKTSQFVFPSKVKVGSNLAFGKKKKNTYEVTLNGQNYTVGDGSLFTGENRYFTTEYKVALLTSIALNNPEEDFIDTLVVIGTPITRHHRVAKKIADHYNGMQETFTVEGREVTVRINNLVVFIEGAYPIYTEEEGRIITIDMGAGTINVTEFLDGSPEKYTTYPEAMYKMYEEIATYLNVTKGGDFKPTDIEPILNKKSITINQEKVDITDIRPIIASHIDGMASLISNTFSIGRADKIYCIGGGSMDTWNYWKKPFPTATLVEDSQKINLKVYDAVARRLLEEE